MHPTIRAARAAGLCYLGMAVAGGVGFQLIRPRLFADGDPAATLANLVGHESLARAGVAVELLTVLTQALTAVAFYRLFRSARPVAAAGIFAFGLVNAVAILISAALMATAVDVALDPAGDPAAVTHLLYLVSGNVWGVAALFFGLWLIPMGWAVLRTGWMPRALGWILVAGGVGYVLSAFVAYLVPAGRAAADMLAFPATVGELWMIVYLLTRGVRRDALGEDLGPDAGRPAGSEVRA